MLKRDGKTRLASDAMIYPDVVIDAARKEQLEYFAFLVECHQQHAPVCRDLNCQANLAHCKTVIRPGKKFVKVDVGTSGKYMIEIGTWIIYGIKAYGVVHRGHSYGTLDTVDLYYWGLYVGGLMTEDLGMLGSLQHPVKRLTPDQKQRIFDSDDRIVRIHENLTLWPNPATLRRRKIGWRDVIERPIPAIRIVTTKDPYQVYFEMYGRWLPFNQMARWAAYSINGGILLSSKREKDRDKLRRILDANAR